MWKRLNSNQMCEKCSYKEVFLIKRFLIERFYCIYKQLSNQNLFIERFIIKRIINNRSQLISQMCQQIYNHYRSTCGNIRYQCIAAIPTLIHAYLVSHVDRLVSNYLPSASSSLSSPTRNT